MLTSGGPKRTTAAARVQGIWWGGCRVFMHMCGNAISMLVTLYFCRIHDNSAYVGSRNTLSMYLVPEYEGYHHGYGDCQIRSNDD